MDLALELGMTVTELSQRMTERELGQWVAYHARKRLPTRRLELYLAQIAFRVAHAFGESSLTFQDCLFDFRKPAEDTTATASQAIGMMAGRKVIKLSQGRKRG